MTWTISDLKSNLISFLYDRSELTPQLATWISLCEADVNRVLKTRDQLKTVTLTPDVNGDVTLPADYQTFRSATALTNPRQRLDHVVSGTLNSLYQPLAGQPAVVCINSASTASVWPITTSDIELEYYASIPALTDSNTSNWLLTKSPTVYLYGTLKHAAIFIGDTERLPIFASQFMDGVNLIIKDDKSSRYGERTISRISGVTP